jgi:hypothetical protein
MMSDKLEFVAASGFHRTFEKLKETLIKRLWFKMKNGANEKDASTVIGLILRCWNSSSAASPLDVRKAYGLPIGGQQIFGATPRNLIRGAAPGISK